MKNRILIITSYNQQPRIQLLWIMIDPKQHAKMKITKEDEERKEIVRER